MPLPANQLQLLSQMLYTSGKAYCIARKKKPTDRDCPDINCLSAVNGFRDFVGYKDGVYNTNKKTIKDIRDYFARRDVDSFYRKAMQDNAWGNTIRLPAYMQAVIDVWAEDLVATLEEKSEVDQLKEQLAKANDELERRSVAPSLSVFETASITSRTVVSEAKDDNLTTLIQAVFSKKRAAIFLDMAKEYYKLPPEKMQDKGAFAMLMEQFLMTLTPKNTAPADTDVFIKALLSADAPGLVVAKIKEFQTLHSQKDDGVPVPTKKQIDGIKWALEKRPPILPNARLRDVFSRAFRDAFGSNADMKAQSRGPSRAPSPTRPVVALPVVVSTASGSAPPPPQVPASVVGLVAAAANGAAPAPVATPAPVPVTPH